MQLGDHNMAERAERSPLDVALDTTLDNALTGLIDTVETGGLDQELEYPHQEPGQVGEGALTGEIGG
jgi:hypothetical protein